MQVIKLLHDSERASETGQRVARRVSERAGAVEEVDLGSGDRENARREAMLAVGAATRIGTKPDAIFDVDGQPDFSDAVVVTEDERGRRELYVGADALEVLAEGT